MRFLSGFSWPASKFDPCDVGLPLGFPDSISELASYDGTPSFADGRWHLQFQQSTLSDADALHLSHEGIYCRYRLFQIFILLFQVVHFLCQRNIIIQMFTSSHETRNIVTTSWQFKKKSVLRKLSVGKWNMWRFTSSFVLQGVTAMFTLSSLWMF